jgi:branched-chain amino acid transport system substrate-binding protein
MTVMVARTIEKLRHLHGFKPAITTPLIAGLLCMLVSGVIRAEGDGVTAATLRVGGVMDLQGDSKGLGLGMKAGIEAAIRNRQVHGHTIELVVLNDFYNPQTTVEATKKLIAQGVFAMLGNVGTPTAKVALPILAEHKIPAVGFFTGSGILRPGVGDIVNFRASYIQETSKIIDAAIGAGLKPDQICAYVQNDSYGMSGVLALKVALAKLPNTNKMMQAIERIQALPDEDPARNNIGPIGFYQRNTLRSKEGYSSIKNWEAASGSRCRLVITVGTYRAVSNFAAYARFKGENWLVSAVSFTGADDLRTTLKEYGIADRIVMTQVVPSLNSNLPIVAEARKALGSQLSYVSLEGFIVGKMFLAILQDIDGNITRDNFMSAVRGQKFNLGGIPIDFSNGNQGSDFVQITYLDGDEYRPLYSDDLRRLLQ